MIYFLVSGAVLVSTGLSLLLTGGKSEETESETVSDVYGGSGGNDHRDKPRSRRRKVHRKGLTDAEHQIPSDDGGGDGGDASRSQSRSDDPERRQSEPVGDDADSQDTGEDGPSGGDDDHRNELRDGDKRGGAEAD